MAKRKAGKKKAPALKERGAEQSRSLSDSVYSIHYTISLLGKLISKDYS